jgi:DNA gyrase/topoisomerase IV subunit B
MLYQQHSPGDGGTHMTAARAMTRTLNNYIEQNELPRKQKWKPRVTTVRGTDVRVIG